MIEASTETSLEEFLIEKREALTSHRLLERVSDLINALDAISVASEGTCVENAGSRHLTAMEIVMFCVATILGIGAVVEKIKLGENGMGRIE